MAKFSEARTHIDAAFTEIGQMLKFHWDYTITILCWIRMILQHGIPDFGFGLSNKPLSANNTEVMYNVSMTIFQLQQANTYVFSPQTAALYNPADKRLASVFGVRNI